MQKSLLWKVWLCPDNIDEDFISYYVKKNNIVNREEYLNKKYPDWLNSESLLPDITKAVNRIVEAINNQEKIIIFWDYDCDWIPGTAICVEALKNLWAKVSYRIPDREKDWYWLKNYLIDEMNEKWVNLIITVDNGISSIQESYYLKEKWIDLIITDHHHVWELLPYAIAIINPLRNDSNYPYKTISWACVAWKLMIAVWRELMWDKYCEEKIRDKYIDLVALSTVADIMPLTWENRVIVSRGIEIIKNTENDWLQELFLQIWIDKSNKIDSNFFAFYLWPLINAAWRMWNPYFALQLLLWNKSYASYLDKLNNDRKQIIKEVLKEFDNLRFDFDNIIVLEGKNWWSWIIWLIAGKITEKFYLPSIVLQKKWNNFIGSCRAPQWFDLFVFLSEFKEYFSHFWWHSQACWFSLKGECLDVFKESILEKWKNILKDNPLIDNLEISFEIWIPDLDISFVKDIKALEPFWHMNRNPVFLIKNLNPNFVFVWNDREHINMLLWNMRAIWFWFWRFANEILSAKNIDLAVNLWTRIWNWYEKLEIQIVDIMIKE